MGIPSGVVLLVGGGYHGKSTLLRAIERSVVPHVPGDGRETVVGDPDLVKIRAEDGTCLFFVNVYALRWPDRMPEAARDRHRWSIGAQLYRDGLTMGLTLHHEPGMTPGEIETFYRTAHAALGCTRDPHNG